MRQLITISILVLTLNCFGQYKFDKTKISWQTEQIVARIEKVNALMSSAVGAAGVRPAQYDNFTALQRKASQAELEELTNHPNGVVRSYAFWALSYDTSANLFPIVINHIRDTTAIRTQFGCIVSRDKVGDFFINVVTPDYVDLNSKKLTPIQYAYLDSLLIYTPNALDAKENAISRATPSESFYIRIRELVLKEKNQSALIMLAKFRREQDIPLILNNRLKEDRYDQLFFTYRAISEFPHAAFLPLLKKSLYEAVTKGAWSTEWREMYKAIASFKDDTALQLLKAPFTQTKYPNIKQYHIGFVFEAVQDFYTPIYDELLWEMWEHEKKINPQVFNLLYTKCPEKGFELIKQTLQNADDFYYLNTGSYSESEEAPVNLLDIMLDTVLARDKPFAIALINKNIREINVHQFPTFADKALQLKDTSFVTSLFDRLEKEDNAYIYLKATEVLIAFHDKDINRRIIEVPKRNANLRKDWGGQEFIKLLKENSIK